MLTSAPNVFGRAHARFPDALIVEGEGGKVELSQAQRERFDRLARPYLSHAQVRRMAGFVQHGQVSTLAHVVRVAQTSFAWAQKLPFRVDEADLVAGALLHDFYLYDWHDRSTSKPHHATRHPLYAAENAVRVFGVSEKQRGIIETHMWPLPPDRVPRSTEAWIVCAADKWCSLYETLFLRDGEHGRKEPAPGPAAASGTAATASPAGLSGSAGPAAAAADPEGRSAGRAERNAR